MAMVMLNIGILAIVASFNSGAVALRRASHISTASALADSADGGATARCSTARSASTPARSPVSTTRTSATRSLGASCPNTVTGCSTGTCADNTVPTFTCGTANTCLPEADGHPRARRPRTRYPYRIDSYILYKTQTSGRQLKQITVVVRDGSHAIEDVHAPDVDVRPHRQQLERGVPRGITPFGRWDEARLAI